MTKKLQELGLFLPYNTIDPDRAPPPAQPGRFAECVGPGERWLGTVL